MLSNPIEQRTIPASNIPKDIAKHLYLRSLDGKAIVLTDKPEATMLAVKKYWLKLSRKLLAERAKTVDASQIQDLTAHITHMQQLTMTSLDPLDVPQVDVFFMAPPLANSVLPFTHTVYVISSINDDDLQIIESCMPQSGHIVTYNTAFFDQ